MLNKRRSLDCNILENRLKKDAHTVLAAGGINGALGTADPAYFVSLPIKMDAPALK